MYAKDVDTLTDLIEWIDQQNESGLSECFDYYHNEHNGRVTVRFPEGDLSNAPARLTAAVKNAEIELDHLSVEPTAAVILVAAGE